MKQKTFYSNTSRCVTKKEQIGPINGKAFKNDRLQLLW
jgi:hypothetical protein